MVHSHARKFVCWQGDLPVCTMTTQDDYFFEGVEKRVAIDFEARQGSSLRSIPRTIIDEILNLCRCQIMRHIVTDYFDSYILSESSLFVYPTKVILKTCGTTEPLLGIPLLIQEANKLGLYPAKLVYSHKNFLRPSEQPPIFRSIEAERESLESGPFSGGRLDVIGQGDDYWFVYRKSWSGQDCLDKSNLFTCDILVTAFCPNVAGNFFRSSCSEDTASSAGSTIDSETCTDLSRMESVIKPMLPLEISSVSFDPCGFSCNGVDEDRYATVHVTPEPRFMFASFELSGKTKSEISSLAVRVARGMSAGKVTINCLPDGPAGEDAADYLIHDLVQSLEEYKLQSQGSVDGYSTVTFVQKRS